MQKVILMVGLPGSGKSTWARKYVENSNAVIVCRDSIRTMLKGKYIFDTEYEKLVSTMADAMLAQALSLEFNIIIDETNITKSKRLSWIQKINGLAVIHNYDIEVHVVEFPFTEEIYKRRAKDTKGYTEVKWKSVIDSMKDSFEPPGAEVIPSNLKVQVHFWTEEAFDCEIMK